VWICGLLQSHTENLLVVCAYTVHVKYVPGQRRVVWPGLAAVHQPIETMIATLSRFMYLAGQAAATSAGQDVLLPLAGTWPGSSAVD
jgi:hypothetical protein